MASAGKIAGGALMFGGTFIGTTYFMMHQKAQYEGETEEEEFELPDVPPSEKERMDTFNELSEHYDKLLNFDEWFLRMGKYRKYTISKASGRVLEVAAGTGRNLRYYKYNKDIEEVYFIDKSQGMIDRLRLKPICRKKIFKSFDCCDIQCLSTYNRYPPDTFDTVIDTFGICSFEDPQTAITQMINVCKPNKKIILLEHGISSWKLVKWWQNRKLLKHVYSWGCYFNRDILGYIQSRDDVIIDNVKRRHFGTTYIIELTKKDIIQLADKDLDSVDQVSASEMDETV